MGVTISKNCKNCTTLFRTNKKNLNNPNFNYCSNCRNNRKNCEICNKKICKQGRTCSKECAYELRKKSWLKTCGTKHNFSKNSLSRKKWEKEMLEKEGIKNVFQRESVKEKSRKTHLKKLGVDNPSKSKKIKDQKEKTCLKNYNVKCGFNLSKQINETMIKKYGQLRISNGDKISEYRKKILRPKYEKLGIWVPLNQLSKYQLYSYNVWEITRQNIKKYGELINSNLLKENIKIKEYKNKWSIDHKYSILTGFNHQISPKIIGSIVNLEILSFSKNSKKSSKCSISKEKLIDLYNIFEYENKKN